MSNDTFHTKTLAIYGADPYPPVSLGPIEALMLFLRRTRAFRRDSKGFLNGDLTGLDYRNYTPPHAVNQGDLAIIESVKRFVLINAPDTSFETIRWGRLRYREEAWSHFLVGGSGYLIFDARGKIGHRLKEDLDFFKRNGITPILFGIGANQPSALTQNGGISNIDPSIESSLRDLLRTAKAISVRDAFTQAVLSRYTDKHVELTGDPALHFGHLNGIEHATQSNSERRRPLIGLNLNFHGPSSTRLLQRNLPIFAKGIRAIRDEHHCQFRYFVHFDASLVIPKLLALEGIEMEVIKGSPETLARGYAELDLHIGGMLHSCILAHSVDTPAIALAYDIKHLGFMELFGLERNCLSAPDLTSDALIERVRDVLNHPAIYREAISKRREHLERMNHDFIRSSLSIPGNSATKVIPSAQL